MANKTIDQVLNEMQRVQADALKKNTLEWYLKQIRELFKNYTPQAGGPQTGAEDTQKGKAEGADYKNSIQSTQANFSVGILGKMILFRYDPKTKDKLPYYDGFPLVIPLTPSDGSHENIGASILGLNLHYLPPRERAQLLTALTTMLNNTKKLDEKSQIIVKYKFLQGASRFRAFKPCLKRYLSDHVKTRLFVINPKEWYHVMMLPIARWQKGSEYQVWADSVKSIRKAL